MVHSLGEQDFVEVVQATAALLDPMSKFALTNVLYLDDHWTVWVRFGPQDQAAPHLLCECDFGYADRADEPFECPGKALARLYRRLELREEWSPRYRDNRSQAILDLVARARHMFVGQRQDDRLTTADLAEIFVVPDTEVAWNIAVLRVSRLLPKDWYLLQVSIAAPSS